MSVHMFTKIASSDTFQRRGNDRGGKAEAGDAHCVCYGLLISATWDLCRDKRRKKAARNFVRGTRFACHHPSRGSRGPMTIWELPDVTCGKRRQEQLIFFSLSRSRIVRTLHARNHPDSSCYHSPTSSIHTEQL